MEEPGFWDNPEESQNIMKELKSLKDVRDSYEKLKGQYEDIETLIEMGYEENDPDLVSEISEELDTFIGDFDALRLSTMLTGE